MRKQKTFYSPRIIPISFFRKNEKGAALREDVNKVLKEMKEDGTLAQITEKYLGKDTSPDEKYFEETIN